MISRIFYYVAPERGAKYFYDEYICLPVCLYAHITLNHSLTSPILLHVPCHGSIGPSSGFVDNVMVSHYGLMARHAYS